MIKRVIWILWCNDLDPKQLKEQNDAADTELGNLKDSGWQETSAIAKSLTYSAGHKSGEREVIVHRDLIIYTLYKRGKR